jgi:acyl-CoA synthetase (AMP-forming)/AMP-acid ligase II
VNIAEILRCQAEERGSAPAIIDVKGGRDRVTSFAELEAGSARAASLLLKSGLDPGDTVLVFQPMSAELYIALMALFRLGITAMFLDPSAGRLHIERCCAIRPPAALIATPKAHLLRLYSPALRRIPRHFSFSRFLPATMSLGGGERLDSHLVIVPCAPETPALITFTSGSTGRPKAAVRTHGFLLEQHRVLEGALHLTTGAVDLTTLPVFVLANLASGVTSLIPDADLRHPGSIQPKEVLRQIDLFHPTSVVASPAFLERLYDGCQKSGSTIKGFRHVFTGGAPVFPDHLQHFQTTFRDAEVVAVYGSTEAEPIAHVASSAISDMDLSAMGEGQGLLAGEPVPEIEVRVIKARWGTPLGVLAEDAFVALSLPAGDAGEIVVTGGHVLKGYLNGVGDEETKFRVDDTVWHRTGDCGYFDDKGRLWLMGRAAAVIDDWRGPLYPFAVECAARQIIGVKRAALLGINGKRILFVEQSGRAGVDLEQVRQTLVWAAIDEIRLLPRIPLDGRHNAKVDYGKLSLLV